MTPQPLSQGAIAMAVPGHRLKVVDKRIAVVDRRGRVRITLSATGARIWKQCTQQGTVAAICRALIEACGADADPVQQEVTATLRRLYGRGLVSFKCDDSAVSANTYHTNMSALVGHVLDGRGWRAAEPGELAQFAFHYRTSKDIQLARFQTFDLFFTRAMAHKAALAERLMANGRASLIPETYTSADAFERSADRDGDSLWFLKHACSGKQRHVFCCRGFDDLLEQARGFEQRYAGHPYVIQRGVQPYLIDGRKLTVRAHVLMLADRSVYLFQNPFLKVQDAPYDAADTSGRVHYQHLGLPRRPFSEYPQLRGVIEHIGDIVAQVMPLFLDDCCVADDPGRYVLLGLDLVLDPARRPYLIEVNDSPGMRLSDTTTTHHRNKVNLVNDWLEIVLTGRRGDQVGGFVRVA